MATAQADDEELQALLQSNTGSLQLTKIRLPNSLHSLHCDITTGTARPFVPKQLRQRIYDSIHGLSHPGVRATSRLISSRFVWPSMRADCARWTHQCLACQRSKTTRHVTAPIGIFPTNVHRFEHVHIDLVGRLPCSQGMTYFLTCVDRFTRWPEAIPLPNIEAATVARAFITHWVARFGVPRNITTDQGRQFEGYLFRELNQLLGTQHLHTTPYHPAANGLVERFHRQLKAAIRCHNTPSWTEALPLVLLGIRTAPKEDLRASPAELTYGTTLRIPGEFFVAEPAQYTTEFVEQLRRQMSDVRPTPATHHGTRKTFVFKELATTPFVFVRHDAHRTALQPVYDGPFPVIHRHQRTYTLRIKGREKEISIDRLKPAHLESEPMDIPQVQQHEVLPTTTTTATTQQDARQPDPRHHTTTRSGRHVRFPDRL